MNQHASDLSLCSQMALVMFFVLIVVHLVTQDLCVGSHLLQIIITFTTFISASGYSILKLWALSRTLLIFLERSTAPELKLVFFFGLISHLWVHLFFSFTISNITKWPQCFGPELRKNKQKSDHKP